MQVTSPREARGEWNWLPLYLLADLGTFVYLTFLDGYRYTNWNWLIAVPVNAVLSTIWPIYWGLLRWIF